jgi:hypothetical protein
MPLFPHKANFLTVFLYLLMKQSVSENTDENTWFNASRAQCMTMRSFPGIVQPFEHVREVLSSRTGQLDNSAVDLLGPMKRRLPLTLCCFCVMMWLSRTILCVREVNKVTAKLFGFPNAVRRECMKPIRRGSTLLMHSFFHLSPIFISKLNTPLS